MPDIKEARQTYYDGTGTLSSLCRQLCFAGIAAVWMLKTSNGSCPIPFAECLIWSLFLFVLSLVADLLQYTWVSIAFGQFHRRKEKALQEKGYKQEDIAKECFTYPIWINWPTNVFFWSKIVFCFIGHIILVCYMASKLT